MVIGWRAKENIKMTNKEKYLTTAERASAFDMWCNNGVDRDVFKRCLADRCTECVLRWLDMEAEEEKIENCPYCGGKCYLLNDGDGRYRVACHADLSCKYSSGYTTRFEAVAKHNLVARAVAGKQEEKL